jgi:CRISPR-associated helicase Cas3/CRISPR-associated endonuclease Cas3-HD
LHTILTTLLAKSQPPELLTDHLHATLRSAGEVQHRIGHLDTADIHLGHSFWTAVKLACLTHDAGKILDGFQDMVTGRIQAWGQRHEVPSLGFLPHLIQDPELLAWTATGVATHHRALTAEEGGRDLQTLYGLDKPDELAARLGPISPDAPGALAHWLRTTATAAGLPPRPAPGDLTSKTLMADAHTVLTSVLQRWDDEVSEEEGLAAVLLQGAVTLADHLSSAHTPLSPAQPLDDGFRPLLDKHLAGKNASLRSHQKEAGQVSGDMLLRAPTGSGKTEAALLWATRQVTDLTARSGGVPRVFYTLPYLSSINAMTRRMAELLEDDEAVGVAHSRAASYHLAQAIAPQDGCETETGEHSNGPSRADAAAKAVSRAAATRLFHETLRVGTPYQLMRAALAGPAHSSTLLDLTNSVFILDELHAYDPQRLGYILASASMWKRLGGRIAVLSATLPRALAELFTDALGQKPQPVEAPDLGLPPRHRLATRSHHLTDAAVITEIQQRLDNDESVLVVANNVAHALQLYEALSPHATERHGQDSALLLHSRYKRGDRMAIEKNIQERFGSDHARRPGLLVATQVVEVSLDVDFDVLFTAAAPLEALLQRFGRTNRLGARPAADVIVHQPAWTTRRGQAGEFADGIYPREPVEAAWQLLTDHDGHTVDERDATSWLNTIYTGSWGETWREEVADNQDQFEEALLSFGYPFHDRDELTDTFDSLFNGTEAILERDRDNYETALKEGTKAAGRLLADDYLIPLPHWADHLNHYDRRLKVRIINATYTSEHGLTAIHKLPPHATYQPGEVL